MRFSLSIVPVFAVSLAQALIVPKYMSNVANDLIGSSNRQDMSEKQLLVQVEYPTELVTESNSHSDQSESVLELNFTIQHKDIDHLMLNDIVIYPTNLELQTVQAESLTAPHLIKSYKNKWEYVSAPKLGYLVNIDNPRKSKENFEQITVQVDIFEVTGKPFYTTQTIDLQLSKPYEMLVIQAPQTSIPMTQGYRGSTDVNDCTQLFCTDNKSSSHQSHLHEQEPQLNLEFSNLQSHSENSLEKHFSQKKISFLRKTILPNVIPTLMGILAGISAAIVGVLLGHFAIYIWSSLCRRNSNKYISIEQSDTSDPERDSSNYHQIDSPSEDLISSTNEKKN
ncbi:hypothetical protein Golomagni_02502 [Golovinomyces magnicellulatus]|nr:hypothetical protein Golomagni_02502 [Golovinomyces magnicellulatus]